MTEKKLYPTQEFDLTTAEKVEILCPSKRQRVVLTITKRHFFDKQKGKLITDQVVHKARYSLQRKKESK